MEIKSRTVKIYKNNKHCFTKYIKKMKNRSLMNRESRKKQNSRIFISIYTRALSKVASARVPAGHPVHRRAVITASAESVLYCYYYYYYSDCSGRRDRFDKFPPGYGERKKKGHDGTNPASTYSFTRLIGTLGARPADSTTTITVCRY